MGFLRVSSMEGNGCKMHTASTIYETHDLKSSTGDHSGKLRCECYLSGRVCQFWLEVKERFSRKLIMNKISVTKIISIKTKQVYSVINSGKQIIDSFRPCKE